MTTVQQILYKTSAQLLQSGIDNPMMEARIMLAYILNVSTSYLVTNSNYVVEPGKIQALDQMMIRRCNREPLAYITGIKEFWGLNFAVDRNTLIPRPDSEILVEAALNFAKQLTEPIKILDLGTGSGCLLLALLYELPNASGIGVDQSLKALGVAQHNANQLQLSDRVQFIQDDWANSVNERVDIVITNPPYIKIADICNLAPEIKMYEPHQALFGGIDGLECYRKLLPRASQLLTDHGCLFAEIGQGQEDAINAIATHNKFELVKQHRDLQGIIRCLVWKKLTA